MHNTLKDAKGDEKPTRADCDSRRASSTDIQLYRRRLLCIIHRCIGPFVPQSLWLFVTELARSLPGVSELEVV